mmetsp:Transcript_50295/g.92964  ORF Transcript_50295/g.92964 Transcript_50295/m.92964 type:complete len:211 (+) Transcript_50295:171-803(+)
MMALQWCTSTPTKPTRQQGFTFGIVLSLVSIFCMFSMTLLLQTGVLAHINVGTCSPILLLLVQVLAGCSAFARLEIAAPKESVGNTWLYGTAFGALFVDFCQAIYLIHSLKDEQSDWVGVVFLVSLVCVFFTDGAAALMAMLIQEKSPMHGLYMEAVKLKKGDAELSYKRMMVASCFADPYSMHSALTEGCGIDLEDPNLGYVENVRSIC